MTPYHEVNPISYEEFLNIIQRETGLYSLRAKASRRTYGFLPSVDNSSPQQLATYLLSTDDYGVGKRREEEFGEIANILSSPSLDLMSLIGARHVIWGAKMGSKIEWKLGWNILIKIHDKDINEISEIKIIYLFREGLEGFAPGDDDDLYNIGQNEYIGWEYKLSGIQWSEINQRILALGYGSGLRLIVGDSGNSSLWTTNYYAHSTSSDILKRIFGDSLFGRFLNWRDEIPMDVKE